MGYHFDDFFEEHLLDRLKKLTESDSEDKADEFLNLIRQAISTNNCGEMLSKRLLRIICDEDDQFSSTPYDAMSKFFRHLYPDYDIRKLEYAKDDGTLINVDYHGDDSGL